MFDETARLLEILQVCFIVCVVLAVIFFLLSVLFFFLFDIKQVFLILTGRAAKRDIRKLEEDNFNTGRLSNSSAAKGSYSVSGSLDTSDLAMTAPMNPTPQPVQGSAPVPSATSVASGEAGTTVLGQMDTTVLGGVAAAGYAVGETSVLNAGETSVLGVGSVSGTNQSVGKAFVFKIIKREMHIHTEELI